MLAVYSSCIICLLCLNFSRANVREMRLESQQGPGGWRRHNGDFRTSCPMDQHVLRTLKKIIIIKRLGYNKNKDFWRKITRLFSDKCINVLISALACKDKQAASPAIRPSDIRNKRHWTNGGYPPGLYQTVEISIHHPPNIRIVGFVPRQKVCTLWYSKIIINDQNISNKRQGQSD